MVANKCSGGGGGCSKHKVDNEEEWRKNWGGDTFLGILVRSRNPPVASGD